MSQNDDLATLRAMTIDLVVAYVSNHHLPPGDIPSLIATVHSAITNLVGVSHIAPVDGDLAKPTLAQIRKSITPDGLVSFLDGKAYKTLRRHLGAQGLDPDGYRAKFGLPADYPMTAPTYSARRSELAKGLGLGRRPAAQLH